MKAHIEDGEVVKVSMYLLSRPDLVHDMANHFWLKDVMIGDEKYDAYKIGETMVDKKERIVMSEIALTKREDSSSCLKAIIMSTVDIYDLFSATKYEDTIIAAVTSASEVDIKKLKYLKVLSILSELENSKHQDET